ncbi:Pex19 protein [Spinellus fusiger]|nr:Pex19 protein [Spinellus fusiger]
METPNPQTKLPKSAKEQDGTSGEELLDNDEFARQLAAGMEELMGHMGGEQDPEMKQVFEQVWKSLDEANLPAPSTAAKEEGSATPGQSFQDTIAQTMNKLKDSSKQVDSSIAEEGEDAFMAELMKQMESFSDNGEFEGVLEGIMHQLLTKEMLYAPIKDLASKYPSWLQENKSTLEPEQYEKYNSQFSLCQQIVNKYESPTFDEKNEAQSKEIMELMQKMQDFGQPPASLLEDIVPGANFNGAEMPDMKDIENCTVM